MHAGADAPDIATGYAVAYPLGVVGAILTLIGLRYLLRIDVKREEAAAGQDSDAQKDLTTRRLSVEIVNAAVNGKTVAEIRDLALRDFVISVSYTHLDVYKRQPHSRRAGFGCAQSPALTDYPDDRDVLAWLAALD